METFIELSFRAVGEQAHHDAVETLESISTAEILLDHTRERGWFSRQRLLVPEWDCHIVVWVHEAPELLEPDHHVSSERDPYRFLEFGGPKRQVPRALAELLDRLGADYGLVERGWLRFETRTYEPELCAALQAELDATARHYVRGTYEYTGSLVGRLEGSIPIIRQLQRQLWRSGLVDHDRILVGYA